MNLWKVASLVLVVGVFSYYGDSIKKMLTLREPDEYEMVKKYLFTLEHS